MMDANAEDSDGSGTLVMGELMVGCRAFPIKSRVQGWIQRAMEAAHEASSQREGCVPRRVGIRSHAVGAAVWWYAGERSRCDLQCTRRTVENVWLAEEEAPECYSSKFTRTLLVPDGRILGGLNADKGFANHLCASHSVRI